MDAAITSESAAQPLVLALDVGTSSVRCGVYDAAGRFVSPLASRQAYEALTTRDGGIYLDADELIGHVVRVIDDVVRVLDKPVAAVGSDTFWHSLLGTDAAGNAITPVYTWADTRSAPAARQLRMRLNDSAVHARTGAVLHPSYLPAKILWLAETSPNLFKAVQHWMSFAEYLFLRLFGCLQVSISMASGTGMMDQSSCTWDKPLLAALPIDESQLSPIVEYTTAHRDLLPEYKRRWPSLAGIPWYLPIGDGAASNVGCAGTSPEWVVAMIGTSGALRVVREMEEIDISPGLWTYRLDRRRFVQGGAFSDGGNVFAWLERTLRLGTAVEVEQHVGEMAPDAHGLTVLPFLAGERSPDWNPEARAATVGMTLDTEPIDVVRAWLEAVAYRFRVVYDILRPYIPTAKAIIGSGAGLLNSPAWMQIMSDVLEQPVIASAVAEASGRGSALMALEALGAVTDIGHFPVLLATRYSPDPGCAAVYRRAMLRQQALYEKLVPQGASAVTDVGIRREDANDNSN